jgi:ABC-type amino acid transport substrate-binding protein
MRKLLLLVGMLFLVGCESEEDTFVVGLECEYPPYSWTTVESNTTDYALQIEGSDQFCDGYDSRISTYLSEELGMELVVRKVSWDGLPAALQAGQIDAIIAAMSPTPERQQTMNFTEAYYTEAAEQVVVVRVDGGFADATSLSDFAGGSFITQMGTFQVELISQLTGAEAGTNLADFPAVINAVLNGVADGYVAELGVAEAQVANNEDLVMIRFEQGFELDPSYNTVAIALRQEDTDLRDRINEALAGLSEETRNEWFNEAADDVEG